MAFKTATPNGVEHVDAITKVVTSEKILRFEHRITLLCVLVYFPEIVSLLSHKEQVKYE